MHQAVLAAPTVTALARIPRSRTADLLNCALDRHCRWSTPSPKNGFAISTVRAVCDRQLVGLSKPVLRFGSQRSAMLAPLWSGTL